nr:ferritin-2, chloroplastic [Ipomoea batatas]
MQANLLKAASVFPLLNSHGDHLSPLFSSTSSLKGLPAKDGNRNALVVCASKGSNNKQLTGVIFEPFEEVKKELSMVPSGPQTSLCRQIFVDDYEAAINEQINVEYNVPLKGLAKFFKESSEEVALKGLATFFKESSEEERDHAEKLMEYQNKRGGKVKLQCIVMPLSEFDDAEKGDALYAMELALSLEKLSNEKLLNLHAVADRNNDVHLADFVESEFLQYISLCQSLSLPF